MVGVCLVGVGGLSGGMGRLSGWCWGACLEGIGRLSGWCWGGCLVDVERLSGGCREADSSVWGGCLVGVGGSL